MYLQVLGCTREQDAGSRMQGAGCREQDAGSRMQGVGRTEQKRGKEIKNVQPIGIGNSEKMESLSL